MTRQMNQTLQELEDEILKLMPAERRLRGLPIVDVLNNYSEEEIAKAIADRAAKKRKSQKETGSNE